MTSLATQLAWEINRLRESLNAANAEARRAGNRVIELEKQLRIERVKSDLAFKALDNAFARLEGFGVFVLTGRETEEG